MTARTCGTCRWWKNQTCKRYPPTNARPVQGYGTQPRTDRDDFCGEHTPTTQDTRTAALDELIASTADQYGDTQP